MRLTAAISLLVLIVFSLFGSSILYRWEKMKIRSAIKTRIKEGVPSNELHTFSFSLTDWEHVEKKEAGKEIIVDNEFYDVVRVAYSPDSVYLEAIHDKEEKVLFAKLEQEISTQWQSIPKQESPAKQLADFFKISILPISDVIGLMLRKFFIRHYTPYIIKHEIILATVIDKPPGFFVSVYE